MKCAYHGCALFVTLAEDVCPQCEKEGPQLIGVGELRYSFWRHPKYKLRLHGENIAHEVTVYETAEAEALHYVRTGHLMIFNPNWAPEFVL